MTEPQALFQQLVDIIAQLRRECPWDRRQTKESIRYLTIEETYELSEAILNDDSAGIREELGDLLMHTIFYAGIAADQGQFGIADVLRGQIEKLVRRHPHIYGPLRGADEAAIRANWEQIKAAEKAAKGKTDASALDGVPTGLPALIQAQRMQEKAAALGFDWDDAAGVWDKLEEELREFREAEAHEEQEAEMGDLFFTLVNLCRHKGLNAEDALANANRKFKRRYQAIEQLARADGRRLDQLGMAEMDRYWDAVKAQERAGYNGPV
ncbi:MAG: nucleoside triphosphate pyrophosphohydrolase [Bacteroidia bacterium]